MILHSSRSSFGAVMVLATALAALSACTTNSGVTLESVVPSSPSATSSEFVESTSQVAIQSSNAISRSSTAEVPEVTSDQTIASTSVVDQESLDRAEIEQVWRDFWALYERIGRIPEGERSSLIEPIAIDPVLGDVLMQAAGFNSEGLDTYGSVVPHPYWTTPVAGQEIAQIGDCQDASQFGSLVVSTGEKKTVGVANNNMLGGFTKVDGSWKLHQIVYLRDVECMP